jgi:hypothetical protein
MNISTHADKVKRAATYTQSKISTVSIKTKKQFLAFMQKAAGIAKAVTTVRFTSHLASVAWAILNAGYTQITGASAWVIQTVAHAAVDAGAFIATAVTKVAGKVWSALNKAQKVITKKDLPGLTASTSAVEKIKNATEKAKAGIDWFCVAGVRFMMDPVTRGTFFIFSTLAVAPIVINAWVGGALFAWAAQGVITSIVINPWFGSLLFVGAMAGALVGAIEERVTRRALRMVDTLQARVEQLEDDLAEAVHIIKMHEKITDKQIKRNGSGYMRKQKPART